ncbi:MAG: hypothetical protein ACLS5K_08520 [Streptococcus salivarius]
MLGLHVADDLKLVEKAWHYATDAHSGQFRQSENYIIHPIQVAGILADLHLDADDSNLWFHIDVVEDTEKTLDDLKRILARCTKYRGRCY